MSKYKAWLEVLPRRKERGVSELCKKEKDGEHKVEPKNIVRGRNEISSNWERSEFQKIEALCLKEPETFGFPEDTGQERIATNARNTAAWLLKLISCCQGSQWSLTNRTLMRGCSNVILHKFMLWITMVIWEST